LLNVRTDDFRHSKEKPESLAVTRRRVFLIANAQV
jgi:hypothetical protein